MSNTNFFASTVTATTTFQQLGTLLAAAGLDINNASVTSVAGYLRNNSASINLLVGTGTAIPTTNYATIAPLTTMNEVVAGTNVNQVWIASASSTVAVDFVEGAAGLTAPVISGIVGSITLTENQVPKADSGGNLVASTIADDGTTVTTSATKLSPASNDGTGLGDATHNFSDLFLASGAVLNYANANVVVTHSSGILTMGTGEMRITTVGTNTASVVTVGGAQTLTSKGLTTPTVNGGAALGATSTELDQFNDVSAYQESIIAAGAITITKKYSGLALVGAGAVTLAAPGATMLGQTKTIEMTADNGDVTLALTNVVGQSSGTTATFNDVGDALVLMAKGSNWVVIKEFGITLS